MGFAMCFLGSISITAVSLAVAVVYYFDKETNLLSEPEARLIERTLDPEIDQERELERYFKEVEDAQ